jgi:hypothetical protein
MKVSGFTIIRNGVKLQYPVIQAITSILPICDEFIVAVGKSEDGTLELIKSIKSDKIRIVETEWDLSMGQTVLSYQTNLALSHCKGDWAFYVQTDEVIHEIDLAKIKRCMEKYLDDPTVDALRFKWLHFFGSHWRYRIDKGWYQKQDRIIRNNKTIRSFGDAFGFERVDGKPLRCKFTGGLLYHYGWVFSEEVMARRRVNQGTIWSVDRTQEKQTGRYLYGDLNRFPVYFGTHPLVMTELIAKHEASRQDEALIRRKFWWNPLLWFRVRYKTGRRVKYPIDER